MVVIRPITLDDLDAVLSLTTLTGFGLTTLPCDAKLLRRRIRDSIHGFEKLGDEDPPRGETYLFVLEDLDTHTVAGTCGICSKVGGFEPFYGYRIETSVHESAALKVRKEIQTLHLVEEHDGPCEIGSLFLAPAYRKDGSGRLLSMSRFLFMAEHPDYFDPTIIAEMRGVVDDQGHSPFWEAVGRHFFDIDFPTADYLSMVNKRFIADLMPKYPIYITLLTDTAQEVVGQVHDHTAPALQILLDEGFTRSGMVDIFEAGPVVRSPLAGIRTIRDSIRLPITQITSDAPPGEFLHVANTQQEFRACRTPVERGPDGARITAAAAAALHVKLGDIIRFAATHATKAKPPRPAREESDASLY